MGGNRHHLFINYGGGFKEEALRRNCSLQFFNKRKLAGMSANFGDFDGDGYPDLYVTEWIPHTLGKVDCIQLIVFASANYAISRENRPGYLATNFAGLSVRCRLLYESSESKKRSSSLIPSTSKEF